MKRTTQTITLSELRVNLTQIIRDIKSGRTIIITSNGKPVAQIAPLPDKRKEAIARLNALGKTAIIGDIISPLDEQWEAM